MDKELLGRLTIQEKEKTVQLLEQLNCKIDKLIQILETQNTYNITPAYAESFFGDIIAKRLKKEE